MNFDDQDIIDKQQIISGLEVGQALLDFHTRFPDKNVKKEDLMKQLGELAMPERYKDLSAQDLQKMMIEDYVKNASMAMFANKLKGKHQVVIAPHHKNIVGDLMHHWEEKGFTVSKLDTIEETGFIIELKW